MRADLEKLLQLVEADVAAIRAEADKVDAGDALAEPLLRSAVSHLDSHAVRCTLLVTRW